MTENFDKRKTHLSGLLSEINSSVGDRERRYFRLRTIGNLIFHFEEINAEVDKNWAYENLVEYFNICHEYIPSIDRDISIKLYNEYLGKVIDYYQNKLGFTVLINRQIVYLIYIIILTLCYYFFNFYVVIAIATLFILHILRMFKKYKAKQVYELFW